MSAGMSRMSGVVGFDGVKRQKAMKPVKKVAKQTDFGLKRKDTFVAREEANRDFLKPVSTLEFDLSSKELKPDYSLKKRDAAEAPSRHGKKHDKKKKHGKLKIAIVVILLLLLAGGGAFAIWGNTIISKLTGGRSGIFEVISAMTSNVKLKTDKNGRTNVLIFGTSGFNMQGDEGDGSEHDGAQLTDSIMLLSADQETKDVAMVNLPRDLYVGNTCTSTGKVNEVYFCSNISGDAEESGAAALSNTMKDIFDVDVQYWIHVDWGALMKLVDGLGGITVTLDEDIDDDWTGIKATAGVPLQLDGWNAVALARARHGTTMGDFSRGNSQQKILAGVQAKIVNSGLDLGTVLGVLDAVGSDVRTNLALDEIKSIFYLLKDTPFENIRQVPLIDYEKGINYLSTAIMNGISYVVPTAGVKNYSAIQKYVSSMFSSNPAVREGAEIVVMNGSGVKGVAAEEQGKLETDGFPNVDIDDAPSGEWTEKYYLYDISGETPETVKLLAERYGVTATSKDALPAGLAGTKADVVVIIGAGESSVEE